MAPIREQREYVAEAYFSWKWEEAIALRHELPRLRKQLKESNDIEDLQMRFINPWGGVSHTEFSLAVEMAKGATAAAVTVLSKWLLDWGKDFLKEYRKKHKSVASRKQKPRSTMRKRK